MVEPLDEFLNQPALAEVYCKFHQGVVFYTSWTRAVRGCTKVSGLAAYSEKWNWYSSPTRCSCIAILWVSLVSFAAITLYVASQR
jgi:hypothetical protein